MAAGKAVILSNERHRNLTPKGVGAGLSVKVNANIGTSSERVHIEEEIEKLRVAEEAGADAVMDLSTGGRPRRDTQDRDEPCPRARGYRPHLPGSGPGGGEKGQHHGYGARRALRGDRETRGRRRRFYYRPRGGDERRDREAEETGKDRGHRQQGRRVPHRMDDREQQREPPVRAVRPSRRHREEIRYDPQPRGRPPAGEHRGRDRQDAGAGIAHPRRIV